MQRSIGKISTRVTRNSRKGSLPNGSTDKQISNWFKKDDSDERGAMRLLHRTSGFSVSHARGRSFLLRQYSPSRRWLLAADLKLSHQFA